MEENIKQLSQRIDELRKMCREAKFKDGTYSSIVFEIEHLVIAITGKQSEEYVNFTSIYKSSIYEYQKLGYLESILGALKNQLLINGIKNKTNSNWEELLHPVIYKCSYKKFIDGYFSDSVESAIKEINTRLKNLYFKYKGKELDGSNLFASVYNDDKDKTLLTANHQLETTSEKDEQTGYRFMLMGMWMALRNPNAHANNNISKEQAIERLLFVSMLMKKIDENIKTANLQE